MGVQPHKNFSLDNFGYHWSLQPLFASVWPPRGSAAQEGPLRLCNLHGSRQSGPVGVQPHKSAIGEIVAYGWIGSFVCLVVGCCVLLFFWVRWFLVGLVGFGWFWLVLCGFGWFWLVLVGLFGFGWLVRLVGRLVVSRSDLCSEGADICESVGRLSDQTHLVL